MAEVEESGGVCGVVPETENPTQSSGPENSPSSLLPISASTDLSVDQETSNAAEGEVPYTVHVAIQANDFEIERSLSRLPARRRFIPLKFRDFQDPENVDEEDPSDRDYKPSGDGDPEDSVRPPQRRPPKAGGVRGRGRGRGRPRKIVKLGADDPVHGGPELVDEDADGSTSKGQTVADAEGNILTHQDRPFRCLDDGCGMTFVSESSLKTHHFYQHGDPTQRSKHKLVFECENCHKTFSQPGNLKAHMRIHTGEKPFPCRECTKSFRSKESLRRHQLTHTGIKPFECDVCKKCFSSNVALKEHRSRHSDSKPYECPECAKSFRQVSCYKRHLLTHSSVMPHRCTVCDRQFSQAIYLRSHMKTHTGEKPFKCFTCGKAFAHQSDRTRHMNVHSGVKRYSCDVCQACFSDPSSCRRHIKEHNGTKPYACAMCPATFRRTSQLRTHMSKKHWWTQPQGGGEEVPGGEVTMGAPERKIIRLAASDSGAGVQFHVSMPAANTAQGHDPEVVSAADVLGHTLAPFDRHGPGQGDPQGDQGEGHATILATAQDEVSNGNQLILTADGQLVTSQGASRQELSAETARILEQIQLDCAQGQIQGLAGGPIQVAYQIIHDDEDQQIVEIQYHPLPTEGAHAEPTDGVLDPDMTVHDVIQQDGEGVLLRPDDALVLHPGSTVIQEQGYNVNAEGETFVGETSVEGVQQSYLLDRTHGGDTVAFHGGSEVKAGVVGMATSGVVGEGYSVAVMEDDVSATIEADGRGIPEGATVIIQPDINASESNSDMMRNITMLQQFVPTDVSDVSADGVDSQREISQTAELDQQTGVEVAYTTQPLEVIADVQEPILSTFKENTPVQTLNWQIHGRYSTAPVVGTVSRDPAVATVTHDTAVTTVTQTLPITTLSQAPSIETTSSSTSVTTIHESSRIGAPGSHQTLADRQIPREHVYALRESPDVDVATTAWDSSNPVTNRSLIAHTLTRNVNSTDGAVVHSAVRARPEHTVIYTARRTIKSNVLEPATRSTPSPPVGSYDLEIPAENAGESVTSDVVVSEEISSACSAIIATSDTPAVDDVTVDQSALGTADQNQLEPVQGEEIPEKSHSLDFFGSALTTAYVSDPDFSSQDYYNWLSAFTDYCRQVALPLTASLFQSISQVHKSLSDILSVPTGILANRDNFRILMTISRQLNTLINDHLLCVLENLENAASS